MEKLSNSSHFLDLGGLDSLRAQAQKDEKGALKEVAKQFEGIFVQMLMKSMRDANAVFKSDNPMNSQTTAFYEQMRDQQLSIDLSDKGMLGLADMMVQQLSPETSPMTPASVLRTDSSGMPMGLSRAGMSQPQTLTPNTPGTDKSALPLDETSYHKVTVGAGHIQPLVAEDGFGPNIEQPVIPEKAVMSAIVSGKVLPSEINATVAAKKSSSGFNSREEFVTRLYPHAEKAAKALGTQPELLIAQSALETGWGQKVIRQPNGEMSNNLFNIKADKRWQGDKTQVSTLEFDHGIAVKQKADFRIYNDIEQSFTDFVAFISDGERYQKAMKVAADPEKFIRALQDAGYATDPQYANKVMQVMKAISAEVKQTVQGGQ